MIQNTRIGLQDRLLLALAGEETRVFSFEDAKGILQVNNSATRHVLVNLTKKRRLQRIERGKYLLIPEIAGQELYWSESPWVIVSHLVDIYYVAFWTAMEYWSMTEQITDTVFVATTKRKRDMRFGDQRFEFVTMSEKKFFGFVKERVGKRESFNVSSREKTMIDGLMHPEYCGGMAEVTKAMWNMRRESDWNLVLEMAEKVEINVVLKRLGYLLSVLGIEGEISGKSRERIRKSPYQYLDPTANKDRIENSKEYGLIINRTRDELVSWMD